MKAPVNSQKEKRNGKKERTTFEMINQYLEERKQSWEKNNRCEGAYKEIDYNWKKG